MSGAETARHRVVQRRIGGAEKALPLHLHSCRVSFHITNFDKILRPLVLLGLQ